MPSRSLEEFLINPSQESEVVTPDDYAGLRRELEQLDAALALNENWRALAQLDEREARGEPLEAVAGEKLRNLLLAQLNGNKLYRARLMVADALEILDGPELVELKNEMPEAITSEVREQASDSLGTDTQDDEHSAAESVVDAVDGEGDGALGDEKPTSVETATDLSSKNDMATIAPDIANAPTESNLDEASLVRPHQSNAGSEELSKKTVIAGAAAAIALAAAASATYQGPISLQSDTAPDNDNEIEIITNSDDGQANPTASGPTQTQIDEVDHAPSPVQSIDDDRLELINGIDEALATRMRVDDHIGLAQISRWSFDDVVAVSRKYDLGLRIASQGWIEQAAYLTAGKLSAYATRLTTGDLVSVVAAPPLPPEIVVTSAMPSATIVERIANVKCATDPLPVSEKLAQDGGAQQAVGDAVLGTSIEETSAQETLHAENRLALKSVDAANILTGLAVISAVKLAGNGSQNDANTTSETDAGSAADSLDEEIVKQKQADSVLAADHQSDYTGDFLSKHYLAKPVIAPDPVMGAGSDVADRASAFAARRGPGFNGRTAGGVFEADRLDDAARSVPTKSAIIQSRVPGSLNSNTYENGAPDPNTWEEEAEVVIVARHSRNEESAANAVQISQDVRQPALGRIASSKDERETIIESHAAYRMEADEASVVIVHRENGEDAPDLPFYKQNEQYEREGTIRKFLKALTGD